MLALLRRQKYNARLQYYAQTRMKYHCPLPLSPYKILSLTSIQRDFDYSEVHSVRRPVKSLSFSLLYSVVTRFKWLLFVGGSDGICNGNEGRLWREKESCSFKALS